MGTSAEKYNARKAGKLWQWSELPDHMRERRNDPAAFEKRVRVFQLGAGLLVDGKLGAKTLAAIHAVWPQLAGGAQEQAQEQAKEESAEEEKEETDPAGGYLLIGGDRVSVPFKVTHHEPYKGRKRRAGTLVNSVVVHQSITSSVESTDRVLRKKGLGVHIMIDGDGSIHQFGDLALKSMAHGNERNSTSIGLELINPYVKCKGYWQDMIDPSPTAWRKRETSDTPEQITALDSLCGILTNHSYDCENRIRVDIPPEFPTQSSKGPSRGSAAWFDNNQGGIIAHGHRPGRYPKGHPRAGQRVKGPHADARRSLWLLYKRTKAV